MIWCLNLHVGTSGAFGVLGAGGGGVYWCWGLSRACLGLQLVS